MKAAEKTATGNTKTGTNKILVVTPSHGQTTPTVEKEEKKVTGNASKETNDVLTFVPSTDQPTPTTDSNAENGTASTGNAKIVGINSASASPESSGLENANDTTTGTPEQAVNSELQQPITFAPEPEPVKPVESVEEKIERVTALHRNVEHREIYVLTVEKLRDFTYERKEQAKDYESNYYKGCTVIIRDDKGNEFKTGHPDFVQSCAKAAEEFCYQRITELNTAIIQG